MKRAMMTVVSTFMLLGSAAAVATISAGPTVGGYATFHDSVSGRDWLRLDSFFDQSVDDMVAAAGSAGFTFANRGDVEALLATLPIDAGQWSSYAPITGIAPNRDLIWGAYGPVSGGLAGWAFSFSSDTSWSFVDGAFPSNSVANGGGPDADQNIWAYVGGAPGVPDAASWAMMIAGFGLVGAAMRRRALVTA